MTTAAENKEAEEFISGKLAQVNVARIEKELAGLWKEAAHGDVDNESSAISRAVSFNLLCITDEEDAEQRCSDLLDEIESHHPCRSILSIFRPDKQHSLNAWVSARCHTAGKSRQICSEQITVSCEGGKPEELASVVLPLVLPDLPVFIWWRRKRISWQDFQTLHTCANRFILDSGGRCLTDPEIFKDAQEVITRSAGCLAVSDLNWRRLAGWCRALADAFDGYPIPVDFISKINKINIAFSGKMAFSNRVLLLTGWLASRLDWQPKALDLTKGTAQFQSKTGPVDVTFAGDSQDENPGHLRDIEIEFTGDNRKLSISPERTADARFIIAKVSNSDESEVTRVSPVLSETVLVGQELEVLSRDPVYEATAAMVSKMLSLRK